MSYQTYCMPNMLQTSASWLGAQLQTHTGRPVVLNQASTELPLVATMALQEYDVVDEGGFPTKFRSSDWTIKAADLAGLVIRDGAEITDVESGEVYAALPIDKRPCCERLDSSGILLTVHTKQVGDA